MRARTASSVPQMRGTVTESGSEGRGSNTQTKAEHERWRDGGGEEQRGGPSQSACISDTDQDAYHTLIHTQWETLVCIYSIITPIYYGCTKDGR